MGLILDSSVAITAERRGLPVEGMLAAIRGIVGSTEIALSVASVMELEHGIWRAEDAGRANRRRKFLEDLIGNVPVYPITTQLARKAGRIDAEQQKQGSASLKAPAPTTPAPAPRSTISPGAKAAPAA
jgi:predicted nucleic acid-binding protein